jgi:hypothetical protein
MGQCLPCCVDHVAKQLARATLHFLGHHDLNLKLYVCVFALQLCQNADDAKATRIAFVNDHRSFATGASPLERY